MTSLPGTTYNVPSGRRLTKQASATLNDIIRVISKNTCASGGVNIRLRRKKKIFLNSFSP